MAGVSIFVVFTVSLAPLAVTSTWPAQRLPAVGTALEIAGLAWSSPPPVPGLPLFLAGGGVVGAAG